MRFASIALLVIGILLLYLLNPSAIKTNTTATIRYVYDGDTVKIAEGETEYKLRITHIDAPEHDQAYGSTARQALIQLCENADIEATITGQDKYHRKLGKLTCNQQNVASYMVANGHAWFNERFSNNLMLALKERQAREQQLGLWSEQHPIAPWDWRQRQQAISTLP